jgi:hypothetical protein
MHVNFLDTVIVPNSPSPTVTQRDCTTTSTRGTTNSSGWANDFERTR